MIEVDGIKMTPEEYKIYTISILNAFTPRNLNEQYEKLMKKKDKMDKEIYKIQFESFKHIFGIKD